MKRTYAWMAMWATLASGSAAQAQYYGPPGPSPYGPPAANGYPPPNVPLGNPPLSGDMIQRLTYLNTMQMMSGGNLPDNAPGWETLTMPPTAAPGPMAPANMAACAPEYACAPGGAEPCLPSPPGLDPQAPIAPPVRRTHLPPTPNPRPPVDLHDRIANFCAQFDGSVLPEMVRQNLLLNWWWRLNFDSLQDPGYRCWADFEFLQWRINSSPVSVPLVTTNPNPGAIGALNEPGTTILFGAGSNQNTDLGLFSGGRITLGAFRDQNSPCALELTGLMTETRTAFFSAPSPGGAAPIVSVPFFATQPFNFINPAGETSLNAGGAPNVVNVAMSTQLWGLEANSVIDLIPNDVVSNCSLMAIVGFRYLDFLDRLESKDNFFDAGTGTIVVTDSFGARNQFYGPQIGARASLLIGRWTVDMQTKLALGVNHQSQSIFGSTTVTNGAFGFASGTTAGGVFAEPSNIGHSSRNVFAVLPEGTLKVYYELTQSIRPFLGYNVLYMSDAIRAANQLDRNVNPTQNAFFAPPPVNPGAASAAAPVPTFRSSDFWAYGFNVGLELRF